jgi:hypothetical protein
MVMSVGFDNLQFWGNFCFHPLELFLMSYSKILWYLESNSQKENALASFWVQRVFVTQQTPSWVMVKCDVLFGWISNIWSPPFFLSHYLKEHGAHTNELITNLGQFLNVSNMFSVKFPDRLFICAARETQRHGLPGNVTSLGQSFSRCRPPCRVGDWCTNQGKSRPNYLKSVDLKV